MKYPSYKYLMLLAGCSMLTLLSCKKDFESINTPPKGATDPTTPGFFNMIVSSLPLTGGEQSVFNSWIYPITQQAIVVSGAYPFDNARDAAWSNYYSTLADYRLLEDRIKNSDNASQMNNLYAMLKTIMAYKTFKTTNYFGDMPYTEGGYAPIEISAGYKPAYDKQSDLYTAILADLKWAVDNFSTDASQYSVGSSETFLKNDIGMWTKFANSMRLYVAVSMYDKDNAAAGAAIAEALTKPLLEDGNDIGLWPAKIPQLEFQWRQWSFSANCYLRMGSTMWNLMSSNNNTDGSGIFDPRCTIFFEPNNAGKWAAYPQNPETSVPTEGGGPYNSDNRDKDWSNKGEGNIYSPVNYYFEKDTKSIPELMLTAAQVHLLKAEVYNRGMGVAANQATAETEYNAGVTASVNMWKSIANASPVWVVNKPAATATSGELNTLLSNPLVKYDAGDAAGSLKKIYAQLWIDQYRQPWDAWLLLRRTGGMTPMSPDHTDYYSSNFGTYNRFVYPTTEADYNSVNWKAATGGSDVNTKKIWVAK